MNYKHIEEPPKPVEKDFLIEIAKSVETIRDCGLIIIGTTIDIKLPALEFEKAFNQFSKKVPVNGGRPKKDFKIIFSGVEVKFIKE
jgi:hypothetical protein